MAVGERKKQGPRTRLSGEKRDRFLEVLPQTGNRRFAAEAIGVDARSMDQRREFDAALDAAWEEALDQADRRLAGATGPLDRSGMNVIKRGRCGRLQITRAGPKRWSLRWRSGFSRRSRLAGESGSTDRARRRDCGGGAGRDGRGAERAARRRAGGGAGGDAVGAFVLRGTGARASGDRSWKGC
jgi:hypothetical protein